MFFGLFVALSVLTAGNQCFAQSTVSLFSNDQPASTSSSNKSISLGVKFWSSQAGTISAIRFYRSVKSAQGYVARLYTASGSILGSAQMQTESGPVPGWQQANFATPIPIAANTTYVADYVAPSGKYSQTNNALTQTVSNGPLYAPGSSQVGGNGVYVKSSGFPTTSSNGTNFFVDVAFASTASPYLTISVNPSAPTIPNTTPLGAQVAQVAVTWSDGSPFTGTLSFGAPNYNDGGVYALDANNNLIINPSGPGVGPAGGTVENVTLVATQ